MKILYNTCFADPWLKVATVLHDKYNFEPVYWIGYEDDNSEELIRKEFPNCYYHPYYDAWKAIFPKELPFDLNDGFLDIDFLRDFASFELQAIKMMDRMDSDQHSFSFIERQRHFRKLLKSWIAIFDQLEIDAVVSAVVPHRVFDYVMYIICKHKNIPFISFRNSAFSNRIVPLTDIYEIDEKITLDYRTALAKKNEVDFFDVIPNDIIETLEKVKQDYSVAEPVYMKNHIIANRRDSSIFGISQKFIKRVFNNREKFIGKNKYLAKGIPTYSKKKGHSIESSNYTILELARKKLKSNSYKRKLKTYYESLVTTPDYNKPYIFLPLHYQPEMTSNPSGDIFVDQILCVDVLASNSPDHLIYIKEHKAQFYAQTEGHTSRIKEFYDDLLKYPNVRLIPLETDTFDLITNSKAVATVTGTSGWEAMVKGKPVIIFGLSWYEKYDGVLKIIDQEASKKISSFIDGYSFDERKLLTYLHVFAKNSVEAYYYRGLKAKMNQSEEECVGNLVSCLVNMIDVK